AGVDDLAAHDLVLELATLDRVAADQLLVGRGVAPAAREDVLQATHCTPPPAYLLLSETQAKQPAIRRQGRWDPRRPAVAHRLRERGGPEGAAPAGAQLGMPEAEARALYQAARRLHGDDELDQFIAPTPNYYTLWVPCRREAGLIVCDPNLRRREGLVLERF